MGQAHLPVESPRAQAEENYGPSSTIQSTKQFWEAAEDNSVLGRFRIPPEERGKTGIGANLKENLRISEKAALIAIQCPAPDRAVFFSFINHPPQFWDGTDGTNVSLVKVDPTRGRRTANTG